MYSTISGKYYKEKNGLLIKRCVTISYNNDMYILKTNSTQYMNNYEAYKVKCLNANSSQKTKERGIG